MTDPIPPPAPPVSPPPQVAQHQFRSLDETIEQCIGEFGWKQFLQSVVVSFACFFDAQQTFITVFTDIEPKWSCNNSTSYNNHVVSCNTTTSNICQLPNDSWSWDLPARVSTISEWSLQCASPIIRGLPASSFLLGCLVGGLVVATLGDSNMGRKNMLVLSCLIMSLSGALTTVSTNIWMYIGLRFISGIGRATIGTCALVHASELVGKKWRGKVGTIVFFCFTLGFLSLPMIAFLLKEYSWRLIYLCTCCPCVCYSLLVYFLAHESPRWLFIKGKNEEFVKTVKSLASSSEQQNILTESFSGNYFEWIQKSQEQHHIYSTFKILLKKSWAFKRLLAMMVVGFGVGIAYYGMPLGLGNLSFNLYLSVALNALAESLAALIMFFLIGKLKRKGSLVGLALFCGICSAVNVFVRMKGMQMGLELLAFFGTCLAFNLLMIYTLELFPTCVRNSAISMVREANLFGGFLGPMIVALDKNNGMLSYGVFGATILLCGLFVAWLPETKGRTLCDTMEEEEQNDEVNNGFTCA